MIKYIAFIFLVFVCGVLATHLISVGFCSFVGWDNYFILHYSLWDEFLRFVYAILQLVVILSIAMKLND